MAARATTDEGAARFTTALMMGVDLGSPAANDGPALPLFSQNVSRGFMLSNEARVNAVMHDNTRMESQSEQVLRGKAAFFTYKLYNGGAHMNQSYSHEATRCIDQASLYAVVEVCSGRRHQPLDEYLVPACREDIQRVCTSQDRSLAAMEFISKWGTHYTQSFKVGARLHIWRQSIFESEQSQMESMKKASIGLTALLGLSSGSSQSVSTMWAELSKDSLFSMEGGDHRILGADTTCNANSLQQWIAEVSPQNAVILESMLRMVSDFFADSPAIEQIVKWAIERRCHMALVNSVAEGLHLLFEQSHNKFMAILRGDQIKILRGALDCPGCDSPKTGCQLNPLTPVETECLAMPKDPTSVEEMMAYINSNDGLGKGRLARLATMISDVSKLVNGVNIPPNKGVTNRRPAPCDHIRRGKESKCSLCHLSQSLLTQINAKATLMKSFLIRRPSWWKPEFEGKSHVLLVGPTNCGKGSLAQKILRNEQPTVHELESIEDIKHYPIDGTTLLHDSPGCGTEQYPLDVSYFVQSGAMYMTRVAVLINAKQGRTTVVLNLLHTLRRHGRDHCLVLTQADNIWHPSRPRQESINMVVSQWREHFPEQRIFVVTVVPEFVDHPWNQLNAFVLWARTGQ